VAAWANDTNLTEYEISVVADLPSSMSDWSAEIAKAQDDILQRIKADWWEGHIAGRRYTGDSFPVIDESLLNTAILTQITCFQALGYYIMPKLARYSDEADSYTRKIDYYTKRVEGEWDKIKNMALYDFNGDSVFSDYERTGPMQRRLARA